MLKQICIMKEIRQRTGFQLSASQIRALRKRLRSLQWQPEAVMREVVLIRRLREMVAFHRPSN